LNFTTLRAARQLPTDYNSQHLKTTAELSRPGAPRHALPLSYNSICRFDDLRFDDLITQSLYHYFLNLSGDELKPRL
jgi:hypothetical protein